MVVQNTCETGIKTTKIDVYVFKVPEVLSRLQSGTSLNGLSNMRTNFEQQTT